MQPVTIRCACCRRYVYLGYWLVTSIIIQPFVEITVKNNIAQAYKIPSGAMLETLLSGDHIIANKFIYKISEPKKGDIVIFPFPKEPTKEKLHRIRKLRNASIGHPTKNNVKKSTYYNYISRMTLSKNGFTLMRCFEKGRTEFVDIDISSFLSDQLHEIEGSYKLLALKLSEADRMHREIFKNKLLVDLFHSSMSYTINKVAEGIHSPSASNVTFGL